MILAALAILLATLFGAGAVRTLTEGLQANLAARQAGAPGLQFGRLSSAYAMSQALQAELAKAGTPEDIHAFYMTRDFAPLWIEAPPSRLALFGVNMLPDAPAFLRRIGAPASSPLAAAVQDAGGRSPALAAKAEIALSTALVRHVLSLPAPDTTRLAFVDPSLSRPTDVTTVLEQAAAARSPGVYVAALDAGNPLHQRLRAARDAYQARWARLPQTPVAAGPALRTGHDGPRVVQLRERLGLASAGSFDPALETAVREYQSAHGLPLTGQADAATLASLNAGADHYLALIDLNLRRAESLPPITARRYLVVNVPAGELQLVEDGRVRDAMPVAVGTRSDPTPMMAGMMRYLVFNPYWNVPVDIVQETIAPKVLARGPKALDAAGMEALSDWSEHARVLDPHDVPWRSVASARDELRVRQRPGGDNMMGQVKFMMPNELGIYLHDTPNKAVFQQPVSQRLVSAGCVRLERAMDVAYWLLGFRPTPGAMALDEHVDLASPVPVYIAYMTAAPGPNGVVFHPDVYGWDRA